MKKRLSQIAATTEAAKAEPSLLDEVIANTKPKPETPRVPKGYTELAAGIERRVSVNTDWLRGLGGLPFRVITLQPEKGWNDEQSYTDVVIAGEARMSCSVGCGGRGRGAYLLTKAALYVKS